MNRIKRKQIVTLAVVVVLASAALYFYDEGNAARDSMDTVVSAALNVIGESRLTSAQKNDAVEKILASYPTSSIRSDDVIAAIRGRDSESTRACGACAMMRSNFRDASARCGRRGNRNGDCTQQANWASAYKSNGCFGSCGVGLFD